jgi:hypothetical protein
MGREGRREKGAGRRESGRRKAKGEKRKAEGWDSGGERRKGCGSLLAGDCGRRKPEGRNLKPEMGASD